MNYSEMTDEELFKQTDVIDLADKFLNSQQGKLVLAAADRIVERAVAEFAMSPTIIKDIEKLIELRVIIKKYKFGLFEEIKQISREGFLVYQELQNRHPEPVSQESLNSTEKGDANG